MKKYIFILLCVYANEWATTIGFVGIGYVGLVSSVGFAELGHKVLCYDIDQTRLAQLQQGTMPFYEPGLEEICRKNLYKNLFVAESLQHLIQESEIIFFAVNTPMSETGAADLTFMFNAIEDALQYVQQDKIFCIKSTVPVGTCNKIKQVIKKKNVSSSVSVISIPEFLREGAAIYDFFNPHRVVIGLDNSDIQEKIVGLYAYYQEKNIPIVITNLNTSECIKYASNAFLATKIAFINEMYQLSLVADVDVETLAHAMGLDARIGSEFLRHGPGYGGSCFPKDTEALAYFAQEYGTDLSIVRAVINANKEHKHFIAKQIIKKAYEINPTNPKVAALGLSFKPETDDVRYSPAIDIINELIEEGIEVKAYDPMAMENAKRTLHESCILASSLDEVCKDVDCIIILTAWRDFDGVKKKIFSSTIPVVDVFNL